MACAKLLELCVKDWEPIDGKTVHIPIGFKRSVDFRVGNYLIEFHPIRVFREWSDGANTKQLMLALSKCSKSDRASALDAISKELAITYAKKRRFCMDFSSDEDVRNSKLLVATNSYEFCDKVLPVVATNWLPNRTILISQFYKWRK